MTKKLNIDIVIHVINIYLIIYDGKEKALCVRDRSLDIGGGWIS